MMKSLWNSNEAKAFAKDPLKLRVYTSQLLGRNPDLVMHGGGNTSVKMTQKVPFGEQEEILYIKGSGWDLATITQEGFAPVRMSALLKMAQMKHLSDTDMVKGQRAAMTDPGRPTPSVEAILHAIIPYKYVDHTHADVVVTITNTRHGEQRIKEIYGNRLIVIPYVMPGFILARKVYELTRNIDWEKYDGIVLLQHGVFTFDNNAQRSYEKMISLVRRAENYIQRKTTSSKPAKAFGELDLVSLAKIRKLVSHERSKAVTARWQNAPWATQFANRKDLRRIARQGPLTPDHVIRTKRVPIILEKNYEAEIKGFRSDYEKYFNKYKTTGLTCLDPAPRWAIVPKAGTISFGGSLNEIKIVADITEHTVKAIEQAERLDEWKALTAKHIFDVEYWELEQAKLKKAESAAPLQGKIALVTGAASGIGRTCVLSLHKEGALVAALDINKEVTRQFSREEILPIVCDATDPVSLKSAVESTVRQFGGLDIVVSNAGIFPNGQSIEQLDDAVWQRSMDINLTSHKQLMKYCIPYLAEGIDPTIIVIASKNVPAPGPGAAAYSVAKAGLTQLARIAALELGAKGIRVNVVHPNQIFDTAIWTKSVLESRARQYGLSVEEYKCQNVLRTEITSHDVARLVCTLAGPAFLKTTGAQIPIDGGNERVI